MDQELVFNQQKYSQFQDLYQGGRTQLYKLHTDCYGNTGL